MCVCVCCVFGEESMKNVWRTEGANFNQRSKPHHLSETMRDEHRGKCESLCHRATKIPHSSTSMCETRTIRHGRHSDSIILIVTKVQSHVLLQRMLHENKRTHRTLTTFQARFNMLQRLSSELRHPKSVSELIATLALLSNLEQSDLALIGILYLGSSVGVRVFVTFEC